MKCAPIGSRWAYQKKTISFCLFFTGLTVSPKLVDFAFNSGHLDSDMIRVKSWSSIEIEKREAVCE